jgi:hypothetical protein
MDVSVTLHDLATLSKRTEHLYYLDRRQSGPRSDMDAKEKKILTHLPGIKPRSSEPPTSRHTD